MQYGGMACGKVVGKFGIRGKMWRIYEKLWRDVLEEAVILERVNIELCWYLQGVARGSTLSPNLLKVYINDMIVAVEAAKQGVTVGDDAVSRVTFANGFEGIEEIPGGLQKRVEKVHCSIRSTSK